MSEVVKIKEPDAVIDALTARIQELERTNEQLKKTLERYVELPREVPDLLGIMRMREVIPLYVGSKSYEDLKQDFAIKGEAAIGAFEKIWFLDKAPVSHEVKHAVRRAANHGNCRW